MTSDSSGRTIDYSTFDKPTKITKGSNSSEFIYGIDRQRWIHIEKTGTTTKTQLYIGGLEKVIYSDGSDTEWRRYLGKAAIYTAKTSDVAGNNLTAVEKRYLMKDYQGTIDVVTDQFGSIIEVMSFDAWGERRNGLSTAALSESALTSYEPLTTPRGYTGHEMLDGVGLLISWSKEFNVPLLVDVREPNVRYGSTGSWFVKGDYIYRLRGQ